MKPSRDLQRSLETLTRSQFGRGAQHTNMSAASQTLMNPFPKLPNRMKRNPQNTKWVADSDIATKKQANRNTSEVNRSDNHISWYRAAKSIYESGPVGEGQEAWRAWKIYQRVRKEQHDGEEVAEQDIWMQEKEVPEYDRSPHLHPYTVLAPTLPPANGQIYYEEDDDIAVAPRHARKDSGVSQSSIGVPPTVKRHMHQAMNANKPLPPVPRPGSAPEPRRTVRPPSPPPPLPPPPPTILPTQRSENTKAISPKTPRISTKPGPQWWKRPQSPTLKSKISYPLLHPTATPNTPITPPSSPPAPPAPPPTRPLITRRDTRKRAPLHFPKPAALNLTLANNTIAAKSTAEMAVGARDAVAAAALHLREGFVGSAVVEKGKIIRQSTRAKMDAAARRRRGSDASFECRGVRE
jgi:hypothetical protein